MLKHCVIRKRHFKNIMAEILALREAGYVTRWSCKKIGDQWQATSTKPLAASIDQLRNIERAVA